jgi:peptidoglycan/xylan/chitin deacetylase (PgdA/CDA1 family)
MLRNPMFAIIAIIILMTLIVGSALLNTALGNVVNSNNKAVMLGFDGGWKSQITYAEPILALCFCKTKAKPFYQS